MTRVYHQIDAQVSRDAPLTSVNHGQPNSMVKVPSPHRGVGEGMLYFRLYYFDRFSGHIDHFREFEAESDSAAIGQAERWGDGRPMELWNRERRLKHWDSVASTD